MRQEPRQEYSTPGELAGGLGAQQAAQQQQLSQVIGVVVGYQQGLAQDGLPLTMGDGGEEVGGGVGDQLLQGCEVGAKSSEAFFPSVVGRRGVARRPVAGGEVQLFVFGVAAEVEDVPLRDAEVLQQLPGGVGRARGLGGAQLGGPVGDDLVEADVGVAPVEQLDDVLPQGLVVLGDGSLLTRAAWRTFFARRFFFLTARWPRFFGNALDRI